MEEYLTPSGKMMNEYDLADLTMEQVFNMLIKLDVADKALYRDFKKLNEDVKPKYYIRPRIVYPYYESPNRYRSRSVKSPSKFYYTTPTTPINPNILTATKMRLRKAPRSSPSKRSSPTPNYFRSAPIPGTIACNLFGSKAVCQSTPPCVWTDGVGCN